MNFAEHEARARLASRRSHLVELAGGRGDARLTELLRLVDGALADLDAGTWASCAVCHEPIAGERLAADPLVRVCLDCLSVADRRALERDLEAAARVQQALLPPRSIEHDGWQLEYLWEPLGAVSGDHVDLVRAGGNGAPCHVVFGDVAGKGLAASLLQSNLHALFRALSAPEVEPCDLLGRANRYFAEATAASSYATLAVLRLFDDGRLELANAGHPRPLLADARGVRPVEGAGVPLGLFAGSSYRGHDLRLGPGETLLLYTDGWTEAERDGEEYGIGRAAAALRRAAHLPLAELLAACRADLDRFLGGARRNDDLTLLALRRAG